MQSGNLLFHKELKLRGLYSMSVKSVMSVVFYLDFFSILAHARLFDLSREGSRAAKTAVKQ